MRDRPLSASASGRFGVTTAASGSSSAAGRLRRHPRRQQPIAALRDHHRIDDHERQLQRRDRGRDRLDDRGVREHAGLVGIDRDVAGDRFNLRGRPRLARQRERRLRRARVLRGHGRDRAGAVHAERGERLQVRLDARAAAGVAPRNCQRCSAWAKIAASCVNDLLLAWIPVHCPSSAPRSEAPTAASWAPRFASRRALRDGPHGRGRADQRAAAVHAGAVHVPADGGAARRRRARRRGSARRARCCISRSALPGCRCSPPRRCFRRAPARLLGPTGGYLMAYPFAAFVTGWLAERGFDRRYLTAVVAMVCGLVVVFAGGVLWLARGLSRPAAVCLRRSAPASIRSSSPIDQAAVSPRRDPSGALASYGSRPGLTHVRAPADTETAGTSPLRISCKPAAFCSLDHGRFVRRARPAAVPAAASCLKSTIPIRPCGFSDAAAEMSAAASTRSSELVIRVDDEHGVEAVPAAADRSSCRARSARCCRSSRLTRRLIASIICAGCPARRRGRWGRRGGRAAA